MKIIIQKINTEIYLVLTYEICFLKLKIKYHHCQWGNPLLSSPIRFSRNALCNPPQGAPEGLHRPTVLSPGRLTLC